MGRCLLLCVRVVRRALDDPLDSCLFSACLQMSKTQGLAQVLKMFSSPVQCELRNVRGKKRTLEWVRKEENRL